MDRAGRLLDALALVGVASLPRWDRRRRSRTGAVSLLLFGALVGLWGLLPGLWGGFAP